MLSIDSLWITFFIIILCLIINNLNIFYFDILLNSNKYKENSLIINMERGQSEIITVLIITVLVILSVIILWQVSKNLLEKNKEDLTLDRLSDSLNINKESTFVDNNSKLLQLQITRRSDNINITKINVVIYSDSDSSNYIIEDYPNSIETKNYLFNISELNEVNEILVYPLLEEGQLGLGKRLIMEDIKQNTGQIDTNLQIINPINLDDSENLMS